MSISQTTLSSAMGLNDLTIQVASATGFALKNKIRIDDEWFTQTADNASGTSIQVRGGEEGSYRKTHVSGALVYVGLPSDFPVAPPGTSIIVPASPAVIHQTVVIAGAITLPLSNHGVFLTLLGTTTNAYTLADPLLSQEGQEVTIQAGAAHAYTVQALTSLGVASEISFSGDQDLATFGGAIGDDFKIKAVNGTWQVLYLHNVTLSDS